MFWKRIARFSKLQFFGQVYNPLQSSQTGPLIERVGVKPAGYMGNVIALKAGTRLARSRKVPVRDLICPPNVGVTAGVPAASNTAIICASVVLTTLSQIILAANITNPTYPRNVTVIAHAGTPGDGTLTSANAKWVTFEGTNQFDEPIIESVPLNSTNAVASFNCFKTITKITFPIKKATSDEIYVGLGTKLALSHPCQATTDVIECARKASAAVAYTSETIFTTMDLGEAYVRAKSTSALAALAAGAGPTVAYIYYTAAGLTGTFPTVPYLAELIDADSTNEVVTVTATDADTPTTGITRLTIVRGAHGQTGALPAYNGLFMINWKCSQSVAPTITADDRYRVDYLSQVL